MILLSSSVSSHVLDRQWLLVLAVGAQPAQQGPHALSVRVALHGKHRLLFGLAGLAIFDILVAAHFGEQLVDCQLQSIAEHARHEHPENGAAHFDARVAINLD